MTKIEAFLKKSPIYPALVLEYYFTPKKRRIIIRITKYITLSIPATIVLSTLFGNAFSDVLISKLLGVAILSFNIYILMHLFDSYFASTYYFEYVADNRYSDQEYYTFSAGRLIRRAEKDNLLVGLLTSQRVGKKIIARLGISKEETEALLLKQKDVIDSKVFDTSGNKLIKVWDVVSFVYDNYPDFKNILDKHGIGKIELEATVSWVVYQIEAEAYNRQWWRPEKLAKIPGVAADWSFGRTYLLNKYSRNILHDEEVNSQAIDLLNRTRETTQIQAVLERSKGANVILVGNPGQEKMDVVWSLARLMQDRTCSPQLVGKKLLLFLTNSFTAGIKDQHDFENKLEIILNEAMRAGNIVLVIDSLPHLILQAKHFGTNLDEILEPYLSNIGGQVIALADTEYFRTLIENDKAMMGYFEVVQTKTLPLEEIVSIIGRKVLEFEPEYEIFFTYPAILEIAKSADYYFPDGVSSDEAKDLLTELCPWAVSHGLNIINKNNVLEYISEKTDIPSAGITDIEKDKLLNLENLLMKRIVAQRDAVFAIASAVRRSRAGIRNEKRPIGSFLFFGPTGVGKTETAKALADVFFGNEKHMLRLDMSEYQNEEALARLIGSVENKTQGVLPSMLKEHPYGVLLLDEFEKTNKDVLNLFLQIIDEGYFSDAYGRKVMARNIIFIATSNAGAENIFKFISSGENINNHEEEIIADIIKQGIFRPELINRFDGTILFHPLTKENLVEIARLMLKKLAKRLSDKGITLEINNELINFLVEGGYNPSFGARPMNRLIQDTVEEHVSDLIIRGQLTAGKNISFKIVSRDNTKNSLKPVIS